MPRCPVRGAEGINVLMPVCTRVRWEALSQGQVRAPSCRPGGGQAEERIPGRGAGRTSPQARQERPGCCDPGESLGEGRDRVSPSSDTDPCRVGQERGGS